MPNKTLVKNFNKNMKKRNNFDMYIEEIVKQKNRRLKYISDNLILTTPIDINSKQFSKLKKKTLNSTKNFNNLNIPHKNVNVEAEKLSCWKSEKNIFGDVISTKLCSNNNTNFKDNKCDVKVNLKRNTDLLESKIVENPMQNLLPSTVSSKCKNKINIISNVVLHSPLPQIDCTNFAKATSQIIPNSNSKFHNITNDLLFINDLQLKYPKNKNVTYNYERHHSKQFTFTLPIVIDENANYNENLSQTVLNQPNFVPNTTLSNGWLPKSSRTVYTCTICKAKFVDRRAFRHHLYLHESKKYNCDLCCKGYRRKQYLTQHISKYHI